MVFPSFSQGRGTVVTGRVEQGKIKVGEDVEILGLTQVRFTIIITMLTSLWDDPSSIGDFPNENS